MVKRLLFAVLALLALRQLRVQSDLQPFEALVQEISAIGSVVLQSAEILGLILGFAMHFICVSIEYYH